jgi:hypothetical protein
MPRDQFNPESEPIVNPLVNHAEGFAREQGPSPQTLGAAGAAAFRHPYGRGIPRSMFDSLGLKEKQASKE